MFDHTQEKVTAACGLTSDTMHAALRKIRKEVKNEPFEPYTAEENRAILLMAVLDSPLIPSALAFLDKSLTQTMETASQAVEMAEKYPPTADTILKTMAMHFYISDNQC